jgi:flagellar biosynthesis regulator FlbT
MEREKFPNGKVEEILTIWRTPDRKKAIEALKKYLRMIEFIKAESAVTEARNFHFLSQLYLSDEVGKMTIEFLNKLHAVYVGYKMVNDMQGISDVKEISQISEPAELKKEEATALLEKVVKQMRSELSIGYYHSEST